MKFKEVGSCLEEIFPPEYAEPWDNTGWMVCPENTSLQGILVAVDPTPEALDVAQQENKNLLLCHHPLIFDSLDSIQFSNPIENMIITAIEHKIGVYAAHTNADSMAGGLNDKLANLLNLLKTKPIRPLDINSEIGLGRMGKLSKRIKIQTIIDKLQEELDLNFLQLLGNPDDGIQKVGICSGSGGDFIGPELAQEIDLYITADVKHHQAEKARLLNLPVINLDHYEMESVFQDETISLLEESFPDSPIDRFRRDNPYTYYSFSSRK